MDDLLLRLQRWYAEQCDTDSEHQYGVRIETLDNPGWSVIVDLNGTSLEGVPFENRNTKLEGQETQDWLACFVEGTQFKGFGDPTKLSLILMIFLSWADEVGG